MRKKLGIFVTVFMLFIGGLKLAAAEDPNPMRVYQPFDVVPQSELIPLGAPEDNGGTVLEGDIELKGRIDFVGNGMAAGIFQATTRRGVKAMVHMPFSEHATVIVGR